MTDIESRRAEITSYRVRATPPQNEIFGPEPAEERRFLFFALEHPPAQPGDPPDDGSAQITFIRGQPDSFGKAFSQGRSISVVIPLEEFEPWYQILSNERPLFLDYSFEVPLVEGTGELFEVGISSNFTQIGPPLNMWGVYIDAAWVNINAKCCNYSV